MGQSTRWYWGALLILVGGCQTTPTPKVAHAGHMFVVRETSICPAPAQARSRECGNSVESAKTGYRLRRGERIEVYGPVSEGVIGSPRYLVEGKTFGFVRADDLALVPDLSHLQNANLKSPRQIDLQQTPIALVAVSRDGDRYPVDPPQIQVGSESFLLPECLENSDGVYFEDIHICLTERDCDLLNYTCDEGYCDTLTIEIEDSTISAVADRFGVFKSRSCDRYQK